MSSPGTVFAGEQKEYEIWMTNNGPSDAQNVVVFDISNNVASSKNLVQGRADLKIAKFGKPDGEVVAGEILIYAVISGVFGLAHSASVPGGNV
jgi:uncharacterized repeat protein (TIGR01451 family)